MGGIDWTGLLKGMGLLALSVSGGHALGKAIIALSLPERLLGSLLPRLRRLRIPAQALFALGVSLGSSRAGSALVAEAYGQGILSEREALFGTLLQSFPGYLKRGLVSFPGAAALAARRRAALRSAAPPMGALKRRHPAAYSSAPLSSNLLMVSIFRYIPSNVSLLISIPVFPPCTKKLNFQASL